MMNECNGIACVDPEFIRELFAQFGPVTVKRLFGSAGIFSDGLMFALVFDGAIFLKVDDTSIPDFEREGSRPFTYTRAKSKGRAGRALAIAQHKKLALRPRSKRKLKRKPRNRCRPSPLTVARLCWRPKPEAPT